VFLGEKLNKFITRDQQYFGILGYFSALFKKQLISLKKALTFVAVLFIRIRNRCLFVPSSLSHMPLFPALLL